MAEEDNSKKKGDGAAIVYVETVNNYGGPNVTLTANDVKAYTTAQSDAKFTVPIASATVLGKIKVGAGLTIDANGVLGTNSSAPDWSAITNKPAEFPPNKAGTTVVGGVKVGTGLSIGADGTLSATATAPDWSQISNKPSAYPPTTASATKIGGVKQGAGIFIDPDTGTINTTGAEPTWDAIKDKPVTFPPPVASNTRLGGVKEGVNIEIDADGSISATVQWDTILGKPTEYPTPVASKTVRGGVYVGDGLQDDGNGVLSLRLAQPNDIGGVILGKTLVTNPQDGRTDVVAASKENAGIVIPGDSLYIDDNGYLEANPGAISPATADTLGGVKIGVGVKADEEGVLTLAPATAEHIGGVKVGSNFSITSDGVLGSNLIAFANRQVFNANGYYAADYTWTLPDGIKYFRVTVQGAGATGGYADDDASKGTGGGGGGGGAYGQTIYLAEKLPKGSVFEIHVGSATDGNANSGQAYFRFKDNPKRYIGAYGGEAGESGNSDTQGRKNGYAKGGRGGAFQDGGTDLSIQLPAIWARGGDGMPGICATGPKGTKTVGGAGGASMMSPSNWGGYGGYGFGTQGSGESGDMRRATAGNGVVIVEW